MKMKVEDYIKLPVKDRSEIDKRIKILVVDGEVDMRDWTRGCGHDTYLESVYCLISKISVDGRIIHLTSDFSISYTKGDIGYVEIFNRKRQVSIINNIENYTFILDTCNLEEYYPELYNKICKSLKDAYRNVKLLL